MELYRQKRRQKKQKKTGDNKRVKGNTDGRVYSAQFWWEPCPLCAEICLRFRELKWSRATTRPNYKYNHMLRQAFIFFLFFFVGEHGNVICTYGCVSGFTVCLRESASAYAHVLTTTRLVPDVLECAAAGQFLGGFGGLLNQTPLPPYSRACQRT